MKLTESSKMFEALKSLYITGFAASWRKARPLAAPRAIFIRVDHGSDTEYPEKKRRILSLVSSPKLIDLFISTLGWPICIFNVVPLYQQRRN